MGLLVTLTVPLSICSVDTAGPEVVAMHHDQSLLLCWPPREEPGVPEAVANMGLTSLRAYTGNTVIYIGELRGLVSVHHAWYIYMI